MEHQDPGNFPTPRARREAAERLVRLLQADGGAQLPGALCRVAAEVIDVSGAGVMVLSGGLPQASLCTTGPVSALIEELQYTLGEGPCVDAHRTGAVVSEPDLSSSTSRWPAFGPKALDAGARAVFGFPVRIGAARVGALNLYRDRPGRLSDDQHADALVMADLIARVVLAFQGPDGLSGLGDADIHAVVHQAAGMVASQLDISVGDALARLRARAFSTDRRLSEVAEDVVARRLKFDDSEGT